MKTQAQKDRNGQLLRLYLKISLKYDKAFKAYFYSGSEKQRKRMNTLAGRHYRVKTEIFRIMDA